MPGSHGSLTKAGKVRNQTPKVESNKPKKLNPKMRNRKNYFKRIVLNEAIGQNKDLRRR
ncbi:MAG: 30S ribosomal protein S30e [Candidatus Helarchaeota archaeon]